MIQICKILVNLVEFRNLSHAVKCMVGGIHKDCVVIQPLSAVDSGTAILPN